MTALTALLLVPILAFLGYMISKWIKQDPTGLIKYDELSNAVSKNISWHLPFVIIGFLLSFLVNLVTYAIFSVMFILSLIVELFKWIYSKILIHIWEVIKKIFVMISDILVMIIKIIVRYLITIPLDILITVINSVPSTLKWEKYYRTFKILAIASIIATILTFIGHLTETPSIGAIGAPFILVIAITYIVGMVTFNSKESGIRAAKFALMLIALILSIGGLIFMTNQLDTITSWGGVFAGLLYAPSVLSISIATFLLLIMIFITNVGAVYVNTVGANLSFQDKLKGSILESWNRSYSFILQPLFSLVIGIIIVAIPYLILQYSSNLLKDEIVAPSVSSTGKSLSKDLSKIKIAGDIMTNTGISGPVFDSAIIKIGNKCELERKIEENKRYDAYLSSAIVKGISFGILPVLDADKIKAEIKSTTDQKKALENTKTSSLKAIDEEIKANTNSDELSKLKIKRTRTDKYMSAHIAGVEAKINYQNGNSMRYNLTYFLFLLGGGILSAVLITFMANIYAASVKPVFEMWSSSFIVDQVKEARSKNPLQPWVGLILIMLFFGAGLTNIASDALSKLQNIGATANDKPTDSSEKSVPLDSSAVNEPVIDAAIDSDGDGVLDDVDDCQNEIGTVANGGCPEEVEAFEENYEDGYREEYPEPEDETLYEGY
jgi:hypothetical protein